MVNKIIQAGLITILVFLLSCGSQKLATKEDGEQKVIAEQKELIQSNITDPEKKEKLLQIVDEIQYESEKFFDYYQKHNKNITLLNNNYNSTRQEFEKAIGDINQQYEVYLKMLIRKRSEMIELTSKDEWAQIMDRESTFIPE